MWKVIFCIVSTMSMVAVSFVLTSLAFGSSAGVIELDPNVRVGSLTSLLTSEFAILLCGVLALKANRGNNNIKLILSGFLMSLVSGDLANDLAQTFMGQGFLRAVLPVVIPATLMAIIAANIEENQKQG